MKSNIIRFKTPQDGIFEVDRNIPEAVHDKWTTQKWQEFCNDIDSIIDPMNRFKSTGFCCCCCCCFFLAIPLLVAMVGYVIIVLAACSTCAVSLMIVVIPVLLFCVVVPVIYCELLGAEYGRAIEKMEILVLNESKTTDGLSIHVRSNWKFQLYSVATLKDDYIEFVSVVEDEEA